MFLLGGEMYGYTVVVMVFLVVARRLLGSCRLFQLVSKVICVLVVPFQVACTGFLWVDAL